MVDEWITLEIDPSKLLGPVNNVIASIDSILSLVIAILNLADVILSVVKAFLVGLLDPIRTLIEILLDELRGLINDLRQLGVYVCGDWKLLTADNLFADVVGGFTAYERRMIARLVDRKDPNRPNFSANSPTLGVFLYISSGDVALVIKALGKIAQFFNGGLGSGSKAFPAPTTPKASFGSAALGVASFGNLSVNINAVPDTVAITWTMPAGMASIPSLLAPAPYGFIIEVSTVPNGMLLVAVQPKDGDTAKVAGLPKITQVAMDVKTNQPLRLFGGLGVAGAGSDGKDWTALEAASPLAPQVWVQIDPNSPLVKPSSLIGTTEGKPLIGNSYYLKAGLFPRLLPGQSFTAVLDKSSLPLHATFSSDGEINLAPETNQYYIRVRAATKNIADAFEDSYGDAGYLAGYPVNMFTTPFRLFNFTPANVRDIKGGSFKPNGPGVPGDSGLTPYDFSNATSPVSVTFPTAISLAYIQTVQSALAVAILSRADMNAGQEFDVFEKNRVVFGQVTGMETIAGKLFSRYGIEPSLFFIDPSPSGFRYKINTVLQQMANDQYDLGSPADSVAQTVNDLGAPLLSFKWSDIDNSYPESTILQSVVDEDDTKGVGSNPFGRGRPNRFIENEYDTQGGPDRNPCFYSLEDATHVPWIMGQGSADRSPIVYSDDDHKVEFIRNALYEHGNGEIIEAANNVLQIAAASLARPARDSDWIAFRLIPQALAPLDGILDQLEKLLDGLLAGTQGIIDQIVAVIEAVQARIHQLQALIEQIRALLQLLRNFQLPSLSGLAVVANGTDGLLASLVSSQNKPQDASDAYGAGALIVAGGLPGFGVAILQKMLGG